MGLGLLRRHEMGDYLQRVLVTPGGNPVVTGNVEVVADVRAGPPVAAYESASSGHGEAEQERGEHDHSAAQRTFTV